MIWYYVNCYEQQAATKNKIPSSQKNVIIISQEILIVIKRFTVNSYSLIFYIFTVRWYSNKFSIIIVYRDYYNRGHAMWRRGSINFVTTDKIFLNKTKYKKYLEVFRFVLHCVLNKYQWHCLALHSIITRDQTYPSFRIHTPNTQFNNISHVTRFPPETRLNE